MAEIKPLFGGGAAPGEPDAAIIDLIAGLLERAKRGEMTGFAYATITPGGAIGTGWDGVPGSFIPLTAAASMLQQLIVKALIDNP